MTGGEGLQLLSCREVDRQYRLRHGTAAREVRLGRVPAKRRGRAWYILARRAALVWGAP